MLREHACGLASASTIAHNNSLGIGRQQDWSCHALEHELSYKYDVAHGAGLAVVTLGWMKWINARKPQKLAQFAARVLDVDPRYDDPARMGAAGIQRLSDFFERIGMPLTFEALGCNPLDIPELSRTVKRRPDGLLGFYCPMGDQDIIERPNALRVGTLALVSKAGQVRKQIWINLNRMGKN